MQAGAQSTEAERTTGKDGSHHMKHARTGRRARALSATLLGASVAMSGAIGASASSRVASTAATAGCKASGLDIWFNNEGGGGAAGSIYYELEFTNLSGRTCALRGFPGVSATDLRGRKLGRAASRDTSRPSVSVALAPGATAAATLRIVQAGNFPAASCHPVTAAGLRVFAPGQTTSRWVPFPFATCSAGGPGVLSVRTIAGK